MSGYPAQKWTATPPWCQKDENCEFRKTKMLRDQHFN